MIGVGASQGWVAFVGLAVVAGGPAIWWIWRQSSDRRGAALVLRLMIFVALLLSLLGIAVERGEVETAVFVVVDETPSVSSTGRGTGEAFVEAVREVAGEDRVRKAVFTEGIAGEALLREAMNRSPDQPTRFVLITDGVSRDPAGDEVAARKLAATGVPTDVVVVDRERGPEVELADLEVPAAVQPGQAFDVVATVRSNGERTTEMRLYADGLLLAEREAELTAGENRIVFANVPGADGGGELRAEVIAVDDTFAENNVALAKVATSRSARVLVLDPEPGRMEWLAGQLRGAKFEVEVRPTNAAPERIEEWNRFDLVVLSDSGAEELGEERMRLLRTWVADLGGGLVFAGGENAFAAGGYRDTPLAELAPVELDYEDTAELPVSALMIALDRSGSMAATVGGQTKMALADAGAVRAMDALQAKDFFGVLAVDTEAHAVVPLGRVADRALTADRVLGIQAGGGGIYVTTALVAVYRALRGVDARIKHVILFSDASDAEEKSAGGFEALDLAGAMLAQRITVSVVALGGEGDRDTEFLRVLAERGGGRFYLTSDALSLPRIFAEESLRATRSNLVETAFRPVVAAEADEIAGIDWEAAPFVLGYDATSVKAGTRVLLATERGEPLLATGRVGLGKVAAFTSDLKGRWTGDWLGWMGFGKLVAQLARATARGAESGGVTAWVESAGGEMAVVVDAMDRDGQFANGADVVVTRLADSREARAEQVAPGRYRAVFGGVAGDGNFSVRVGDGAPVAIVARADENGEFAVLRDVGPELDRIVAAGRGMLDPTAEETLRPTGEVVLSSRELSPWFLALAILLVPVDVWVRRRSR